MQQLAANIIFSASLYALVGVGFAFVYRSARFFHFAHGAIITVGAYAALLPALAGWPIALALLFGVFIAISVGCLVEFIVYRPLRRRGATALAFLLASLGAYIVLQNAISLLFGDAIRVLWAAAPRQGVALGDAVISWAQIVTINASILTLTSVLFWLHSSEVGIRMRAIAEDPELAQIKGVSVSRLHLLAIAIGSGLAGLAGGLIALDVNMVPTMGLRVLLLSVAAVVVGGLGGRTGMGGICAGAALIATLEHGSANLLPTQWQDTIVFAFLMLVLLVRPHGLFAAAPHRV
jgi:branched-chain amino acid transport system permease protein